MSKNRHQPWGLTMPVTTLQLPGARKKVQTEHESKPLGMS